GCAPTQSMARLKYSRGISTRSDGSPSMAKYARGSTAYPSAANGSAYHDAEAMPPSEPDSTITTGCFPAVDGKYKLATRPAALTLIAFTIVLTFYVGCVTASWSVHRRYRA